jgi:hypothetical protein
MPRFHFNIRNGSFGPDESGTDLPDLQSARVQAIAFTGELLKDHSRAFWESADWQMTVTDDRGLVLFTVHVLATDAPVLQVELIPQNPA